MLNHVVNRSIIKYLFKYITKGVDRARAVFEDEEFDEDCGLSKL